MKIEFDHLPEPSSAEIQQMWDELEVTPISGGNPKILTVLNEIRSSHKRGGAEFLSFKLSSHRALSWYGALDRLMEINFLPKLLMHPKIVHELKQVNISLERPPTFSHCETFDAFTFDGFLSRILAYGGAYRKEWFEGLDKQSKTLSIEFCEAVFQQRYSEVQVYYSPDSWNSWFPGPDRPWNHSFFGLDKRLGIVWMLFVADID